MQSQMVIAIHPRTGSPWVLGLHQCSHERIWTSEEQILFKDISLRVKDALSNLLHFKELFNREQFLNRIIDQSPFATWISDSGGTLQRVNPALKRFLNLTDEQLVGKYNVLQDPVVERQGLIPLIRTVYEAGQTINFTCDWDGNDIPTMDLKGSNSVSIEATMFPIHNPEGELTNVVLSWIDITERKQAEEELRQSEETYRTLLSNLDSGVVVHAPDTSIIIANSTACSLLGLSEEQMKGKEAIDPQWKFLRDDNSDMPVDEYPVNRVLSTNEPLRNLVVGVNRPHIGDMVWVLVNGFSVFNESGQVAQVIISFVDITERKRAEQALQESEKKFHTLFETMTEMAVLHEVVFDKSGQTINYRITDCNNAFTKITGINKAEAIGKLATEVYQTETAPYLEEYAQVERSGEPYEFTIYHAPMDKHFLISAVSPQKGQFATISTDITAIKQIEEVVSTKNKELENYLFVASHDLRSPLVNIQGFSRRLQKQIDSMTQTIFSECRLDKKTKLSLEKITNEGIPKSLDFIFVNVAKMNNLINGLLQISRTGRVKMTIKKINVNKLIEKIGQALSFQIEEGEAIIHIGALPDC
ncbi:MAG: PAS domain S-box protein, partial [Planctomycetes bacterium]|nr:PAS domain S-box protein [Planctomycetota bacterium]